ncbi:dehydrogenase [Croceicoccus estronivorus]|uniref:NAD(P)H-dependent oxidoreductase n=1 Tax=Croceicoccus estronivorus TaxID=1172626 RepID=UPI00083602CE|nr:NAD(P)H-dependent oxidoreductase [Croceicoccus estronivorus]OCC25426.1 dehydrogenase [Croceicoccus estronivorus]
MTRILIIDGHPDPDGGHFIHAAADAYAEGAATAYELKRIAVAKLNFPILRSPEEWQKGEVPPDIAEAQEALRWADHVVIFYPLWLGDLPALLKGFFEQVARPGFAFSYTDKGFPKKLLKGRSARVVVTMGMPSPLYRFVYRAHSVKSLERNFLQFVGFKPVRHSIIGSIDASARRRLRWLERMRNLGTKGA